MSIKKQFGKYVSQNIMGMIGLSCYILADSYFIAKAQGANGLTALNLVLPLYNIIFAIGSMIGVGSAIRYSVEKFMNQEEADKYIFNALVFTTLFGLIFAVAGGVMPEQILKLLGADSAIVSVGTTYTRIFMIFAPVFMWNYVANAYVRNDGAPTTAMIATLLSSLFNIVFDYILMFPLNLGMAGAALATAFSPVIGIAICCTHLLSKRSHVRAKACVPSVKKLFQSCQLGVSAFVAEMSSGVITLLFNFLILGIAGNVGVAAYGVVANISLVAIAVFNGIAQGSQPLISDNYGKGNIAEVDTLKRLSLFTAVVAATVIYLFLFINANGIIGIFNHENNAKLEAYAESGIKLYFLGIFFSSVNIAGSSFFSATEKAKEAFVVSMSRGFICIILAALVLSALFGMNGVWLAYMVAELVTCIVMVLFLVRKRRTLNQHEDRKPDTVCFMNMCMMYDENGNVLALDKENDSYTGTTFPGGHVEKDEIFQESVIREIREETGLVIKNPQLGGVYHWTKSGVHNIVFLYKTNEFSGSLKSSEEGRVYWIPLEEFKRKELAAGMEYVLQILESPQINECYMHLKNGKCVETLY